MSKFYKIYLSVIAVFLVLLIVGATFLALILDDYEKNQPTNVAERYFAEQIKTFKLEGYQGGEFEKADVVKQAFKEKYLGKELTLIAGASNEKSYEFVVKSDNSRLATFTVAPSGEKSGFGVAKYKVSDLNFFFGDEISVRVPEDCTLYINGVAVTNEYLVGEGEADNIEMPQGYTAEKTYTYKVKNICANPKLSAKDSRGEEHLVSENASAGEYQVAQNYSEELEESYGALAMAATKAYAAYMQNDVKFAEVAKYFEYGTSTYNFIRTSEVVWVWEHDGYDFSDDWCGEFKEYSSDVFTARVKLTQRLYRAGNQPYVDYIDVNLCFKKQPNGKFLVYSLSGNS